MARVSNSLYAGRHANTFSGPGYGGYGSDAGVGLSSLARALFAAPALRNKAEMDAAHTDYYKAASAKSGVEAEALRAASGARGSIADIYRQIPTMMAGKNAQGPAPAFTNPEDAEIDAGLTQDAADQRATSSQFFQTAPSEIAVAATRLPAAEQGRVAEIFHFLNANTPGTADASVARSLVGTGKTIGQNDAVSLTDREDVAGRNQRGKVEIENIQSGDRQRGQDISAETGRRGQDISAETQRRGQDVSADTRTSIAEAVAGERQRNNEAVLTERQRNNEAVLAERARANEANEALKRERAANAIKVTPNDYRRYANILSDIGGDKNAGDTVYEPEAEAAIIGRASEVYRDTKDAVGAMRQSLMEIQPQLERRDSSWNPLSKRRVGLKTGGGIVEAATGAIPQANAATPAPGPGPAPSTAGTGGSAAGAHAPGARVTVNGKPYIVAPDGDSLLPVQ